MKKLTDQQLDSIFKHASENFEAPYDPSEWEVMAGKLNQPSPVPFKSLLIVGAALLIFVSGVWLGFELKGDRPKEQLLELKKLNSSLTPVTSNSISDQHQNISDSPKEVKTIFKESSEKSDQYSVVSPQEITDSNHVQLPEIKELREKGLDQHQVELLQNENNVLISQQAFEPQRILPKEIGVNTADSLMKKIDSAAVEPEHVVKNKTLGRHSFFIRALASPDLSSVNFSSTNLLGTNYALLIEYQINNKLSVSTGAIWSMKKYSSDQEMIYGGHSTSQLTGECRILDIPVNVYYNVRSGVRNSIYAGLGFSSYIMLKEDYTYVVNYRSGPYTYNSSVNGKNNEWFKMLNISLGWQHQVSSRIYLQVEPFVRAPLSGVGEGDILLSSMGAFVGIKYKIK